MPSVRDLILLSNAHGLNMISNFSLKSEMNQADICNGQFCLSSFERAKTWIHLFDVKSVAFVGYRVIDHMI